MTFSAASPGEASAVTSQDARPESEQEATGSVSLGGLFNILILGILKISLQDILGPFLSAIEN